MPAIPGSKTNILVVDDYPANLLALSAVLSDKPYNLIEAHSGEAALKVLETNVIALVLLDIQMPVMDGYEVATRMRANPKTAEIPIIFITAHYREEPSVRKGYAVGGQDYIGKPFDPEVLKAKVDIYCRLFARTLKLEEEKRSIKGSEERYRLLVEAAQEIIAAIDNNGTITSLNLSFERLTGFKCAAWIGKSFFPLLDPGDATAFLDRCRGAHPFESGDIFQTELVSATQSLIPVEISISPIRQNGETVGTVGIIRDISHRSKT